MSSIAATPRAIPRKAALSSPTRDAWNRYKRNKTALAGAVIVAVILFMAIFAPLLAPGGYEFSNLAETLQGPSGAHLLGTDEVGRDLLSRVIWGARTSMTVGFLVPLLSTLIGLPMGAVAGWFGGKTDFFVQRILEAMAALPTLLVAILMATLYGSGMTQVALYLAITGWVTMARLTRAQFIALREREFVTAARAIGTPPWRIMLQHILPNAAGPIIVIFVLSVPGAVFGEAGLSFLGLGVQDPIPSWGKMITEDGNYMQLAPLIGLVPMLCIFLTMLGFSFVGDGLRDALDPSSRE
ncbi:MAG TPA: ABC transporter permease [Chloroflexota bacterium]|nr:ABC transporter permease [Chloroflexota bacterium]